MNSKSTFSASLLLVILCTNFLGAYSQADCVLNDDPSVYPAVSETPTGALRTKLVPVGGTDPIVSVRVRSTTECSSATDANCYVTAAANANRVITFSPVTATSNFTNYLDFHATGSNTLSVQYEVTCNRGNPPTPYTTAPRTETFTITDTNNRAPVFDIQNPYFELNLETWESQEPVNFRSGGVHVTDQDFSAAFSNVSLATAGDNKDILFVGPRIGGSGDYSFDLFLSPDANPGNYSITLEANDGATANKRNSTVYLYIAGGAQYQATALTVLLVALATWFNLK